MPEPKPFSHLDSTGRARMVDVSGKPPIAREAIAEAFFCAASATLDRLLDDALPKADALATARIAGIQAAKRTSELIPLCHPLPLTHVEVHFERTDDNRLRIQATTRTIDRTGVEMEALTACSIAALTLWDMTKAVDNGLRVTEVTLVSKTKKELTP